MTLSMIFLWRHFEIQMGVLGYNFLTFKWTCLMYQKIKKIAVRLCDVPNDAWSHDLPSLKHLLFWLKENNNKKQNKLFHLLSQTTHTSLPKAAATWHCNADVPHSVVGNFQEKVLLLKDGREENAYNLYFRRNNTELMKRKYLNNWAILSIQPWAVCIFSAFKNSISLFSMPLR